MQVDIDKNNIVRVLGAVDPKKCAMLRNSPENLSAIKAELGQASHTFVTHIKEEGNFKAVGVKVHCYTPGKAIELHTDNPGILKSEEKLWWPFASMILFLNTTPYGNGSVEFPKQKQVIVPLEGTAIFFPTGWTHPYMQKPMQVTKWCVRSWIYREIQSSQS